MVWWRANHKQSWVCAHHVLNVVSKVPAQRGGPSGVQHVPWRPWQRLLLWDWRLVRTDPWAERGTTKPQSITEQWDHTRHQFLDLHGWALFGGILFWIRKALRPGNTVWCYLFFHGAQTMPLLFVAGDRAASDQPWAFPESGDHPPERLSALRAARWVDERKGGVAEQDH